MRAASASARICVRAMLHAIPDTRKDASRPIRSVVRNPGISCCTRASGGDSKSTRHRRPNGSSGTRLTNAGGAAASACGSPVRPEPGWL